MHSYALQIFWGGNLEFLEGKLPPDVPRINLASDSQLSVIPSGCHTGLECSTATRSERALSVRLSLRAEDRSIAVVIP